MSVARRRCVPGGEQGADHQFAPRPIDPDTAPRPVFRQSQIDQPLAQCFVQFRIRPAIHALQRRLLILGKFIPADRHVSLFHVWYGWHKRAARPSYVIARASDCRWSDRCAERSDVLARRSLAGRLATLHETQSMESPTCDVMRRSFNARLLSRARNKFRLNYSKVRAMGLAIAPFRISGSGCRLPQSEFAVTSRAVKSDERADPFVATPNGMGKLARTGLGVASRK